MGTIGILRSGGQSGVDRAALDTAKAMGVPIRGWCPKGGWAEDCPEPPGVLRLYPELRETPLARVEQRTVWNVRDADATLIIDPRSGQNSPGTRLTERAAWCFHRPLLVIHGPEDIPLLRNWLAGLGESIQLNVAGPRASECPQAREIADEVLREILQEQRQPEP